MDQRENMKKMGRNALRHCLISVFTWSMVSKTILVNAESDQPSIDFEAPSLTKSFLKKFKIGEDLMEGDNATIGIKPCQMSLEYRAALQQAIFQKRILKDERELLAFWQNFTINRQNASGIYRKRSAIYLEVGGGKYIYPELFEQLVIAQNGRIIKNMHCSSRKLIVRDDDNIQQELRTNIRLCKAFKSGKGKFFVYHKFRNALVSLYPIKEDELVANNAPMPSFKKKDNKAILTQNKDSGQRTKNCLKMALVGGICYYILKYCAKSVSRIKTCLANI
ncbi:MAG: hypothetical protein LBB11_01305 [Puniceicoccales bacterium]|jgi:hypothetical protein|nr:hypothetical protein [Puniceicoccales bacterium]